MSEPNYPVYAEITGPIVMIGFGSIGRGTLPLIERHFKFDKNRMVVIDPLDDETGILAKHGVRHIKEYVTKENYKELLKPLLTAGKGQGFCVNLSVDTGSLDLMKLCRKHDVLYVDTVVEPWLGFYFDKNMKNADRTNYALRETVRKEKAKNPGGATAVSTCGANPGMVSWFVKQALVNLANDIGVKFDEPDQHDREGWARLMKKLGVKGVHIAERDTQRTKHPKPLNVFWNTWSVEGFISEGLQPAELGWGTHEEWMPKNARRHKKGCQAAIYLEQPGANTRVRTWCPTPGPQYGFLVTHNESPTTSRFATRMAKSPSARPAITPITRPMTRFCRCTKCSAMAARRSRSTTFSTRMNWRTASTNSAFSSMAMKRTPTGTARACRSRKPVASPPTRTPPACR
jgi:homospermidine synthase